MSNLNKYEKDMSQAIGKTTNGWFRLATVNVDNGGFMFSNSSDICNLINEITQKMEFVNEHSGFTMSYYFRKMQSIAKEKLSN